MEIKPTKTWLKEHPRYKYCPWPEFNCHCIITFADEDTHNTGLCVGVRPDVDDLDMVMMCTHQPNIVDNKVEGFTSHPLCITPNEAGMFATQLALGLSVIFTLDPEYRKEMGKMRRVRTRQMKESKNASE